MQSQVTVFFFFFQAEDGIRDLTVTGVQTCALPIWAGGERLAARVPELQAILDVGAGSLGGVFEAPQHAGLLLDVPRSGHPEEYQTADYGGGPPRRHPPEPQRPREPQPRPPPHPGTPPSSRPYCQQ